MDPHTPTHLRPLGSQRPRHDPSPSVVCVGGMIRVVTDLDTTLSSPFVSPPQIQSPEHGPEMDSSEAEEKPLLTQKQVRELRRLCRKTANRAEFEDRLIQVRQIASIAAMGTPAVKYFDPHNATSGAALRAWVEIQRELGADWRDERLLADDAIDELRRWDRCLKAWARLRFETDHGPLHTQHSSTMTMLRPPGFASSSPITPYLGKSKTLDQEYAQFSSPVSPDAALVHVYSDAPSQKNVVDLAQPSSAGVTAPQNDGQTVASEVSINRIGDTINITVPTSLMSKMQLEDAAQQGQRISRNEQENVYPPNNKKQVSSHAVNTAKSWRNSSSNTKRPQFTISSERELAFRTAAKALFSNASKDMYSDDTSLNTTMHRSQMDWGKLRRPALRPLSVNNAANIQRRKSSD